MRHHIREGHMQYLDRLYTDLEAHALPQDMPHMDWMKRNEAISCELGIQYTVLTSIMTGHHMNHQTLQVYTYFPAK